MQWQRRQRRQRRQGLGAGGAVQGALVVLRQDPVAQAFTKHIIEAPRNSVWHNVNQFVSGYFLERTMISESHNIVYHNWPANLRVPFRQRLPELLAAGMGSSLEERARKAFAARPRANSHWKIRMGVRSGLRRLGVRVAGVRTNDGVRPPRRSGGKGWDTIGGSLSS